MCLGGRVRDYRGPFDTIKAAEKYRDEKFPSWELEDTTKERLSIWRNYADGTPAVEIPAPFEWEAEKLGYDFEWISPSWAKAIRK